MLTELLSDHGALALGLALLGMLAAGFAKGVVGFALPMIAISTIGSVLPAPLAVAAIIGPAVVTNIWQTFRQGAGEAWQSLRRFWLLNVVMFAAIAATAQLVTRMSEATLFAILGVGVCGFGAIQLSGWQAPRPSPRMMKPVEALTALVAGFFGGLCGVWGPPILMYFMALELPKTEMVRAQGVSFLLGSIILVAAHLRSGLLLGEGGELSALMVIPAMAGMAAGLLVHDRLDQALFRRATLIVLVIAGLNLLRRAMTV